MSNSVLIGVADNSNIDGNYCPSFLDNKIGGKPLFSPNMKLSTLDLLCSNCSENCCFLLQIYCPVDESALDRILYLFICFNQSCNKKQILCFRTLTKPLSTIAQTASVDNKSDKLFDDEWIDDDNWPVEDKQDDNELVEIENETEITEKLSSIQLSSTDDCQQSFVEMFKQCFISVFEEPNKEQIKDNNLEEELLSKYVLNCQDDKNSPSTAVSGEEYEKNYCSAFNNDHINYQFYKRLNRYPDQIIRYDWAGPYLSFSESSAKIVPSNCNYCGSKRLFELQLMPALITLLSRLQLQQLSIDFETVYIFSCSNNCLSKTDPQSTLHKEDVFIVCEDSANEQFKQFQL